MTRKEDIFSNGETPETTPEVLQRLSKSEPFDVPEGYFETLPARVLDVIDATPAQGGGRGGMVFFRDKRWRAIAASLAILLFSGLAYALVTEVIMPTIRSSQPEMIEQPVGEQPTGGALAPSEIPISTGHELVNDDQAEPSGTIREDGAIPAGSNVPSNLPREQLVASPTHSPAGSRPPLSNFYRETTSAGSGGSQSGAAIIAAPPRPAAKPATATTLTDTAVCRGEIVTYRAIEDPTKHSFTWFLNGQELTRQNGPEIQVNTARFRYGTQRLSLVVKAGRSGQVVHVANSAIHVLEAPVIAGETTICGYERVTLNAGPVNPNWEYIWSNGSRAPEITVNQSDDYVLTVRLKGGNCRITDTFKVRVLRKPSIDIAREQTICSGESLQLEVKNPGNDHQVVWHPGNVKSNRYTFNGERPGRYTLQLAVTGCETETRELVIRIDDCRLTIPNFFTPNGDGINDLFVIKGLEYYQGSRLVVTDRNGRTVFESNDYQNDWDGQNLPNGTYFYLFYPGGDEQSARTGMVAIRR